MRRRIELALGACAAAVAVVLLWRAHGSNTVVAEAPPATFAAPADATPAPPAPKPALPSPDDEALQQARSAVDADPTTALQLLQGDGRRFPDSPHADERSYLRMRALVNLKAIAAARAEAEAFFERFPRSPWAPRAFELTGVHPRPPLGPR